MKRGETKAGITTLLRRTIMDLERANKMLSGQVKHYAQKSIDLEIQVGVLNERVGQLREDMTLMKHYPSCRPPVVTLNPIGVRGPK